MRINQIIVLCSESLITPSKMHRYYCEEFEGNPWNHRQALDFCFRIFPPWFRVTIIDFDECETWTLTNNHFNIQARESLTSLRESQSWVLTNGFHANGWFRAIEPCTIIFGNEIRLWMEVDINWNTAWVNITTESQGSHLLFSMRPPRGSSAWGRARDRPPPVVYLRADGSPEPIVGHPPAETDQSRASSDPPTNHDDGDATEQSRAGSNPPSNDDDVEDAIPYHDTHLSPTEIIDEIAVGVHLFMRPPYGEIPFSHISRPVPQNQRELVTQRPITLEAVDPAGILGFEVGMEIVRSINQVRLDGNTGTYLPPNQQVSPRPVPIIHRDGRPVNSPIRVENLPLITRPEPLITPVSIRPLVTAPMSPAPRFRPPPTEITPGPVLPPAAPSTPKPRPPDRPPTYHSHLRPRPTAAQLLNFRVLSNMNDRFHPPLLPVTSLSPRFLVPPIITRTGVVHPRLSLIDESSSSSSSPPSPLRTTETGIRLEITPVAMVSRNQPEVVPVVPQNHTPRDPEEAPVIGDPETNPEA